MTTTRATCWSLTINNPTEYDEEYINFARQRGWKVDGQLEKGKEGTPHYQLILRTPQVRFSAVKKAFPRAHIEIARDPIALSKYVAKQDTRVGSLPVASDRYPSLSKLWELVYAKLTHHEEGICNLDELVEWGEFIVDKDEATRRRWQEAPLSFFDEVVRGLICEGYHVETIAANNLTRTAWKKYAKAIMMRTHQEILHRGYAEAEQALETDRQTDSVQNVNIPVTVENTNGQFSDHHVQSHAPSSPHCGATQDCSASGTSDAESSDEDCEVRDCA